MVFRKYFETFENPDNREFTSDYLDRRTRESWEELEKQQRERYDAMKANFVTLPEHEARLLKEIKNLVQQHATGKIALPFGGKPKDNITGGIAVTVSGRLDKNDRAQKMHITRGRVARQTLVHERPLEFAKSVAPTKSGTIGIKVYLR
eukprot:Colp12_sorted_trinity150504_noHs@23668